MVKEPEIPKGFTCRFCKTYHKFPPYVYAHWRDKLIFECPCGAKYVIVCGHEWLKRKPRKKSAKK
jgi:hypothetical protein